MNTTLRSKARKHLKRAKARVSDQVVTRRDLVQLVNRFLAGGGRGRPFWYDEAIGRVVPVHPPRLLTVRQWQKAIHIARQNRLAPPEVLTALAKHGTVVVSP